MDLCFELPAPASATVVCVSLVQTSKQNGECVKTLETLTAQVKFSVGDLVHHRLFNYRGVIVDVDPVFMLSDEWYEQIARSRPPKDEPWYRVLVHNSNDETYVAERNLARDTDSEPIMHPMIQAFFSGFDDGHYVIGQRIN